MGCFPTRACACACFGHWKHKHVRRQPLPQREELQEADRSFDGNAESSIKEEEMASLLRFVAQSKVENEEQKNSYEKTWNGVNIVEDKKESEGRVPDPASSQGNEDLIAGRECVHLKEMTTLDDGPMGDDGCNGKPSHVSINMVENETQSVENKENEGIAPDPGASKQPEDFLNTDRECKQSKEKTTLDDDPKGGDDFKDCYCLEQLESSESLFSLSIDSRKHVSDAEMGEREVSSGQLKPMENSLYEEDDKENVNFDGKQATVVKQTDRKLEGVITVDTSLSSWLAGSEKTPPYHTNCVSSPESEKNYCDRQVLGVISPAAEVELRGSISCGSGDHRPGFWHGGGVGRGEVLAIDWRGQAVMGEHMLF